MVRLQATAGCANCRIAGVGRAVERLLRTAAASPVTWPVARETRPRRALGELSRRVVNKTPSSRVTKALQGRAVEDPVRT
ncbi:hypothetical protein [Actinoplanes sp. NPDC051411]|uniref:hypothetical protein n=1 Tax=Actinoplanes sp. NPDC051411 TaxID=3155522 RepID=UPI003428BDE5